MKEPTAKEKIALQAKEYLQDHFTDKFSLDDISGALYINKNYLARSFREVTGSTLLQYCNHLRLERAKELLRTSSYSMEIVGYRSGYSSASHFSRVFRSHVGCTPSQYRMQNRK